MRQATNLHMALTKKDATGCSYAGKMGDTLADASSIEGTMGDLALVSAGAAVVIGGGPEDPVTDAVGGFFLKTSESLNAQSIYSGIGAAAWKFVDTGNVKAAANVATQIAFNRLTTDARIATGGQANKFIELAQGSVGSGGGKAIDGIFNKSLGEDSNSCSALKKH